MARLTADTLEATLTQRAQEMVAFAHDPAHFIDVRAGDRPETKYPAHLRFVMRLPGWDTALVFVYSVDVIDGRGTRHLSIQISIPGEVSQAEVNVTAPTLLEGLDSMVRRFFPLAEDIRYSIKARAPIPVVDATAPPGERNVHFRTPVLFHYVVDHGVVDPVAVDAIPEPRREAVRVLLAAIATGAKQCSGPEAREELEEIARRITSWYEGAFVDRVVVPTD